MTPCPRSGVKARHRDRCGGVTRTSHDVGTRLAGAWVPDRTEALHRLLIAANCIPAPGVILRTAAICDIGGYDETVACNEYDMCLRLTTRFGAVHHPRFVGSHRVLRGSLVRAPESTMRLTSHEVRALEKHRGRSPHTDELIHRRILELAEGSGNPSPTRKSRVKPSRGGRHDALRHDRNLNLNLSAHVRGSISGRTTRR